MSFWTWLVTVFIPEWFKVMFVKCPILGIALLILLYWVLFTPYKK